MFFNMDSFSVCFCFQSRFRHTDKQVSVVGVLWSVSTLLTVVMVMTRQEQGRQ